MGGNIDRRNFIKTTIAGALGLSISDRVMSALPADVNSGDEIPMRVLGKTGLKISMIAAPGWHIGRMREESNGIKMLRMAKDLGINFFDSAWEYEKGASEVRVGKAFKNDRQSVYLMTKVAARDKKGAADQLHESLRRMQTDYLDLWQFHTVSKVEDVEQIFGSNGAYSVAEKALQEGKIRHIGLTGHHDPKVLLKVAKEYNEVIETLQMPINVIDPHYISFIKTVIPEAVKHNIGILAMKTCAIGLIIENKIAKVDDCLNFAWSLPISTLVSGMDHFDHLKHNVQLAKNFKPMSDHAQQALLESTKIKFGPDYERYKVGTNKKWRVFPLDPLL